MGKKVMALVTARGGSVGLKDKNVLMLAGKPVIAWTVEAAKRATLVDRVIMSTDSEQIAAISREYGAEVPFLRPTELATATASHNSVILHAVKWMAAHENYHPDYLLLLQPTSPLRTAQNIDDSIRLALTEDCDGVISVFESHNHPMLMSKISTEGFLENFMPEQPQLGSEGVRRQNFPHIYSCNGAIFLVKTAYLLEHGRLRAERTRPYIMPEEQSFQIDSQWDFELIEYLLNPKNGCRHEIS